MVSATVNELRNIIFSLRIFIFINIFSLFLIFFMSSAKAEISNGNQDNYLCPIVQIVSHQNKESKDYQLLGQGWIFKDKRQDEKSKNKIKDKERFPLYILTPAHVVFGANEIAFSCPRIPLSKGDRLPQRFSLSLLGFSPTYDLAVLKINDTHFTPYYSKTIPLFSLAKDIHGKDQAFDLQLPVQPSPSALGQSVISSFFWVENNEFKVAPSGLAAGAWPKTFSIAPYENELTFINGVRPGMSGGLFVIGISRVITNTIGGMIVRTWHNAPASVGISFDEILPKLDLLMKGKDPRREESSGFVPFVSLSMKKPDFPFTKNIEYTKLLKVNSSSLGERILAEDTCSAEKYSPVSHWGEVVGGGSIAESNCGGGSICDSGQWGSGEGSVYPNGFTPSEIDMIKLMVKGVSGQKSRIQKSAYFSSEHCRNPEVKWHTWIQSGSSAVTPLTPTDKSQSETKSLYGLRLIKPNSSEESIMSVESVTDLLRIRWEDYGVDDVYKFYGYINTYGLFRHVKKVENSIQSTSYKARTPYEFLCKKSRGTHDFMVGLNNMAYNMKEFSGGSGLKIHGFESDINYYGKSVRLFEDYQEVLEKNENLGSLYDRYSCSNEGDVSSFGLHATSQLNAESERGYSYTLDFEIKNNKIKFKLIMADGKSPFDPSQLKKTEFKIENTALTPHWTQFFDFEGGHRLEVYFDPYWNTLLFHLILSDKMDTQALLSQSAATSDGAADPPDRPLKLIRLMYKLK